ncbi:MAG: hypothetical protein HUU21_01100 [Polyangiaceae bacterium]|nr:hypothetical protein [Polyangiaceae bacterium]
MTGGFAANSAALRVQKSHSSAARRSGWEDEIVAIIAALFPPISSAKLAPADRGAPQISLKTTDFSRKAGRVGLILQ